MDFLLKNGKIYDGTVLTLSSATFSVRGDRIEKIGEGLICDGTPVIVFRDYPCPPGLWTLTHTTTGSLSAKIPGRFLSRSSDRASPRSSPATAVFPPQGTLRIRRILIRSAAGLFGYAG